MLLLALKYWCLFNIFPLKRSSNIFKYIKSDRDPIESDETSDVYKTECIHKYTRNILDEES